MKHIFTLFLLGICATANAQYLLELDGETPNPLTDKSTNNTVTTVGAPLNTDNAIEFPTGSDYLLIDPFVDFDLDADWTVSFDISVSNAMDSIYVIDWRSNSNVGHMHIGYNGNRGMYFSDRNLNGLYGSLVDDDVPLPVDQWVHFDVMRQGDSLFIYRDDNKVASSYFVDALSPLSTTTVGYSEDFRYAHASFKLDNLTLTGVSTTGVNDADADLPFSIYPNPATDRLAIASSEQLLEARVYNVLGEQLAQQVLTGTSQVDVSRLVPGVYFLELRSEAGAATQRFIKH